MISAAVIEDNRDFAEMLREKTISEPKWSREISVKTERTREYIDRLAATVTAADTGEKIGHPVLDYLIYEKRRKAAEKGIQVREELENLKTMFEGMEAGVLADWCAILGNLWDNAIEGYVRTYKVLDIFKLLKRYGNVSSRGKTTLIKLLLSLYHGDEGKEILYVDGMEMPFGRLGASAAFSEADSPVFCMSVYDNLRMGNQSMTKARCLELIGELGFEDWLNLLPQGLDTVLSESGENVSGGQRQILSVMRAILTDKPVLILDEPFSALDREHADILCAYLERLKEERFILLISHREELYQSGYDAVSLA